MPDTFRSPARLLLVGDEPAFLRDLSGAARAFGHEVISALDLQATKALLDADSPDAVLLGVPRVDARHLDDCRTVGDLPPIAGHPVFVVSASRTDEALRKEAMRAGACHVFETPLDGEELGLRVATFLRTGRELRRTRASGLVDVESGLYNAAGLGRRTREMTAEAMRTRSALGCVVMAVSMESDDSARSAAARAAGDTLRSIARLSDSVGRVGALEFALLAPATSAAGAQHVAQRLAMALRSTIMLSLPSRTRFRLLIGHTSMPNLSYSPIDGGELLARIVTALKSSRRSAHFDWLPLPDAEGQPAPL